MSIYDVMITNNIKGFFSWLNSVKHMSQISTKGWRQIEELIKEYLEDTYPEKKEEIEQ